jgi:hypothetical protein
MSKKAHFSVSDFRATVLATGLARTNRFEIKIIPPVSLRQGSELVSLMAEQATFPLLNIQTKPFKIFGPAYQKPITSDYGGEGTSIVFHVDRDMKVKRFFNDWMHQIVDKERYTVGWLNDYKGTVIIRQLDEMDMATHEVELIDAFPRNINVLDLNHTSTNQTHRLNVLFAYRYWRDLSSTIPNETPTQLVVSNNNATVAPSTRSRANEPFSSPPPRLYNGLDDQGSITGAGAAG